MGWSGYRAIIFPFSIMAAAINSSAYPYNVVVITFFVPSFLSDESSPKGFSLLAGSNPGRVHQNNYRVC